MALTREPNYPPEIAQLVQAFISCSHGHNSSDVLKAAGTFLQIALGEYAKAKKLTKEQTIELARFTSGAVVTGVEFNWQRKRQPTDIAVSHG